MLIKGFYCTRDDGVNLYKIESNQGYFILQNETNRKYPYAIDVEDSLYTYIETDEKIVKETEKFDSERDIEHNDETTENDGSILREQENLSPNTDNT